MLLAAAYLNRVVLRVYTVPAGTSRGRNPRGSTVPEESRGCSAKVALLTAIAVARVVPAAAQSPLPPLPFPPLPMRQGTPEECAACAPDVNRFCEAALQDAMRVLACLQANRPKISAGCNRVLVSHGQ